uniref:CHK domain-containing protein n=1 Tax=Globodera pallida TaxID=36090 RepID=A0A183CHN5_GLOPA
MENKLIKNTNFTIQFVLDKIRACESESAEVAHKSTEWLLTNQLESFEAIDITGGAAFMSTILKVILHWKDPTKYGLPGSIIPAPKYTTLVEQKNAIRAKIEAAEEPPPDRFMDEDFMEESGTFLIEAHKREIAYYKCLPQLDSSLRLPKFYFGSDYSPHHNNGLIIMEDMSTRAVSLPTIPGFNDAHVLAVLDEISKIHSISWKHCEWEPPFPMEMRLNFIEGMRSKAEELLPMFTAEYCEMSSYNGTKYGFPACIVHSDLWSPNILWEKDANGRPTDRLCAIIDWQTVHNGNPCTDISRLLALNTSGQYRRDNTDRLLEYYTRKVADHLGGEAPFTTAQLRDAYKHSLPFSMMYLCFGASIYYYMDSVVGDNANERKDKQAELLHRVLMLLEDTIAEFGD